MINKKEYPMNLMCDIFGCEKLDFILAQDFSSTLKYVLSELPEREQQVIEMRYKQGSFLSQCGKKLGVTRERIRQIQLRALRRLKHPDKTKMLKYGMRKYTTIKNIIEKENFKNSGETQTPIKNLGLSQRTYNCLLRGGVYSVEDLMAIEPYKLLQFRNLGKKAYTEIVDKLNFYGFDTSKYKKHKEI